MLATFTESVTTYCRGVGCIFVEMLSGKPLFPGIKGVYDQLNKIWNVSETCGLHVHVRAFSSELTKLLDCHFIIILSFLFMLFRFWAHPLRARGLVSPATQSTSHVSDAD